MDIANQKNAISDFSKALGCRVTSWKDNGLETVRKVAGEKFITFFVFPKSNKVKDINADISELRNKRKQTPSAYLRIITDLKIPSSARSNAMKHNVSISSVTDYFNNTLNSTYVVNRAISEANEAIPIGEYVNQRIVEEESIATDYVTDDWLKKAETSLLVILAPAGQGKTCLTHVLVRIFGEKHKRNTNSPIPILMPLHRYPHVREFDELVLTHLQDNQLFGLTSDAFAFLVNSKRVIPVLDGFDELAEIGGLRVANKTLSSLRKKFTDNARVILTSREAFFRHRGDISTEVKDGIISGIFETISLAPFNEPEMRTYFSVKGVPNDKLDLCISIANRLGEDQELRGNPLICWAVVEAVKEYGLEKLSRLKGANLFGEIIYYICKREVERQPFRQTPEKQIEIISKIAEFMFDDGSYELKDSEGWLHDLAVEEVGLTTSQTEKQRRVEERITQLENHALLNFRYTNDNGQIIIMEFKHPFFRDYLIADYIRKLIDSSDDIEFQILLRRNLPKITVSFLADLSDLVKMGKMIRKASDHRIMFRNYAEIILEKCDRTSRDDVTVRSKAFKDALGGIKNIEYCDLSGLTIRSLELDNISFKGSNFTKTVFQNVTFKKCIFGKGDLATARFYDCTTDHGTQESLKKSGVRGVDVDQLEYGKYRISMDTTELMNDPIVYLMDRFFSRFISQRNLHQRTKRQSSCYKGLGNQERQFTEKELVPAALRRGIIEEMTLPRRKVFKFNSEWQADGDALLWDQRLTHRLENFIKDLKTKTEKYTLY